MRFTCHSAALYTMASKVISLTPRLSDKGSVAIEATDKGVFVFRNNSTSFAVAKIDVSDVHKTGKCIVASIKPLEYYDEIGEFVLFDGLHFDEKVKLNLSGLDIDTFTLVGPEVELMRFPKDALKCNWVTVGKKKDSAATSQEAIVIFDKYIGCANGSFWSYYKNDVPIVTDGHVSILTPRLPAASMIGIDEQKVWLIDNSVFFRTETIQAPNHLEMYVTNTEDRTKCKEYCTIPFDNKIETALRKALSVSVDGIMDDGCAALDLVGGELSICSRPTQIGEMREVLGQYDGNDFSMSFSPEKLLRATGACSGEEVILEVVKFVNFGIIATDGKIVNAVSERSSSWRGQNK